MPRSAKKFIIKTKNGFDVYVDMKHSHAATHLKDHPHLFDLLKKILPEYKILEDRVRLEVDRRFTLSFPSGKDDKNEDRREFWKNHALVVGNQEIVPGTETRDCPW